MELFIIWLFLSGVAAVIASRKGRSGILFFLLSIILSPLIGIIGAVVVGENRAIAEEKQLSSGENKKCKFCAEIIKMKLLCVVFAEKMFKKNNNSKTPFSVSDQCRA